MPFATVSMCYAARGVVMHTGFTRRDPNQQKWGHPSVSCSSRSQSFDCSDHQSTATDRGDDAHARDTQVCIISSPFPDNGNTTHEDPRLLQPVELLKPGSRRGLLRQVRAASAADLSSVGLGLVLGYSAVALPQMEHVDSWLPLDEEQASWFASLPGISLSMGCVASGIIMERWGRRTALQMQCLPSVLGWALIATSQSITTLYAGRFLTGLGGGMVDAACQVYIGEISSPSVRGAIGASSQLCFSLGVLMIYILGWAQLPWSLLAALCGAVPVLAFIALCCVPESPIWLAARGKSEKARRAALWLQGYNPNGDPSFDTTTFEQMSSCKQASPLQVIRSLMSKDTIKPLFILLTFFFFQQFCGMNAVVFYAVSMFQHGGAGHSDSHQSAVVIGLTRFVMTAITCGLLTRVGRRPLSHVSGLGMAAAMIALGCALYFQASPMLILPCLAFYIGSNTLGFFAVPWVMLGELLPEKCRGMASGLVSCIVYLFVFIVVKTYPQLLHLLGQAAVFWLYGGISLAGVLFVYIFLPETKNRTLTEIEQSFRRRK